MQKIKAADLAQFIKSSGENCKTHHFGGVKRGYRDDLGISVASSWEANYARYLNFLKGKGQIKDFAYEPQTFEFKERHGTTRYTPDFIVENLDGSVEYHEVKGYLDKKSKTKINRFRRDYPELKLIVIEKENYKQIAKWSHLIPNWEE